MAELADSEPVLRRGMSFLGWLGGAFLGVVLLIATWAKAIDPASFEQQIRGEGLAFLLPASVVALCALALEAGLGVALLLNLRRPAILIPATLLVLFFVFLTGRSWWRAEQGLADPSGGCGCFGNLVERTPKEAFVQDVAMLVPTLALAWVARPRFARFPRGRAAVAAAAALGAALLGWRAPALPLDDLATRLKPGVRFDAICAGRDAERVCLAHLAPSLAEGRHLIVLADVRDAGFDALAERLNGYSQPGAEPPLTVLADVTLDEQRALFWRVAPAFDLHEAPAAMLRPLYRALPRSFLLEGGVVAATYPGLPPQVTGAARP
jgi:hypothetical protein